MQGPRITGAAPWLGVAMVFAVVGCGSTTDRTVPVESNDSATGGAELRQAWLAARMREAVSQPEYQARMTERGALLPSPAQELAARLGGGRVELELAGEPVRLELGAAELTCGNRTTRLDEGELVLRENRVELEHGAVTERYLSGPAGIEQVFEVGRAACGAEARELELAFEIGGVRAEAGEGGARFVDERGRAVLSYTDLFARDASGEALSARMEVSAHRVLLRVDVAGARFPVEVDPLFWGGQKKLTASDGAATDSFGNSVALSGDTALVGALGGDVGAFADQGSAYVFVRSGATWTQQQKLVASDGAYSDQFGVSVALSGDTALVGAPSDDVGANANQGSAYVFVRNGATWAEQQKLTASDGAADDLFGIAVTLSGDTALVGAHSDDVGANANQGSAYVFTGGSPCTGPSDCPGGTCVDGFCCDTPCADACDVCAASLGATKNGICTVLPAGATPSTCASPKACNGTSNACSAQCASDLDCAAGFYCAANGSCQAQKAQAATCNDGAGADCKVASCRVCTGGAGRCADGYCCSAACDQPCDVCSQALGAPANGTCSLAPQGVSPTGCPSPKACNGTSATCAAVCASDADCASTHYCDGSGQCTFRKVKGAACNLAAGADCKAASCRACQSDHCVDGVCCDSTCGGQCQACAEAGSVGTCKTVSGAPRAPRPACVGTTGEKCTGTCDGANPVACTYPATGTPCKGASCTGDVAQPPGICDGAGLCALPTTKNCVPYACNATTGVCQASCSSDAECAQGAKCDTNTGKCASTSATCKDPTTVLLPNGQTESCSPYKCLGGACQQQCSVPGDCAPGYTCEATECVVPEGGSDAGVGGSAGTGGGGAGSGGSPASGGKKGESGGDDGGCGCRVPARGGGGTRGVWLGALGLALFFRRARGRSRRVGDPW